MDKKPSKKIREARIPKKVLRERATAIRIDRLKSGVDKDIYFEAWTDDGEHRAILITNGFTPVRKWAAKQWGVPEREVQMSRRSDLTSPETPNPLMVKTQKKASGR